MDGFLGKAARFAAGHALEGAAGAALAASAPFAFAAAHGLAGLAVERAAALAFACASSFLLGLSAGLACKIPGRAKRRREEKRMEAARAAESERRKRRRVEDARSRFSRLSCDDKGVLLRLAVSGGSFKSSARCPHYLALYGMAEESEIGYRTHLISITDYGRFVLECSEDIVKAMTSADGD